MTVRKTTIRKPRGKIDEYILEPVPTTELAKLAAPYNPRKITERALADLETSLTTFGVVEAIVVNLRTAKRGWPKNAKPVIVGGHQRVAAATHAEIETLPVRYVDLDKVRERVLNLALNKISGDFDLELLEQTIRWLQEADEEALAYTGFAEEEIKDILSSLENLEAPDTNPRIDQRNPVRCPKCGHEWVPA